MKKILILLIGIMMVFAFAGCGNSESNEETGGQQEEQATTLPEDKAPDGTIAVFMSVDYPDGCGADDRGDTMIRIKEGDSAAAALETLAEMAGFEVKTDDSGKVAEVNGIKAPDGTAWTCTINGEDTPEGGEAIPADGDDVCWITE